MRKIKKTLIACLIAVFALTLSVGFASMQTKKTANADTYVTQDVAMMAKIAGWHGTDVAPDEMTNGNFELDIILGACDWASEDGQKSYSGDLKALLNGLDFFNKIKLGNKTLAEWGCTACYDNIYWLNVSSPAKFSIRIPLAMEITGKREATKAGIGHASPATILEGALIPSYAYLQGNVNATVYRAGCEFVSENTDLNYGIMSTGKTEVESVEYVQGHDGTCGYFGVSLKGDDYGCAGRSVEREEYYWSVYTSVRYDVKLLVNGEAGKAKTYGLFNLGDKGQGYYAFQMYATLEEMQTVTIPAGTTFPSFAMNNLSTANGNKVLVMYKTQTDVTFHKLSDSTWVKMDDYKATQKAAVESYRAGKTDADYFEDEIEILNTALSTAQTAIESATTIADIDSAVDSAKASMDAVITKASVVDPAKEEVANYKAGLFRDAENQTRLEYVAEANELIDECTSKTDVEGCVAEFKQLVDALKTAAQYADEELAQAKADAKAEISNYLDKTNYYEEQHAAIDAAVAGGHEGVNNATNENEIDQAVVDAKAALDAIATKLEVVDALKAELNAYKADADLFRAEQKTERDSIVATAVAAITADNTFAQNTELVAGAKADIDALKTDAQLDAEELAEAKEDAKAELNAYKAGADLYRDEEAAERQEIVDTAETAIDAATEISAIAGIVADAKADIDALKTDAQLDAEEALAAVKASALTQINEKKAGLDLANYTDENVEKINGLYASAKAAVEAATTADEVNKAVSDFGTAVDAIPTKGAQTSEPSNGGGCSGSVDGASAVVALLTLCGLVFVSRKRK